MLHARFPFPLLALVVFALLRLRMRGAGPLGLLFLVALLLAWVQLFQRGALIFARRPLEGPLELHPLLARPLPLPWLFLTVRMERVHLSQKPRKRWPDFLLAQHWMLVAAIRVLAHFVPLVEPVDAVKLARAGGLRLRARLAFALVLLIRPVHRKGPRRLRPPLQLPMGLAPLLPLAVRLVRFGQWRAPPKDEPIRPLPVLLLLPALVHPLRDLLVAPTRVLKILTKNVAIEEDL